MLIDIKTISHSRGASIAIETETSPEELIFSFQGYRLTRPLVFQGMLQNTGDGILSLTGRIRTAFAGECARCLVIVQTELDLQLAETFRSAATAQTAGLEDSYAYDGNTVDISQAIIDNLLPAMPPRLLCRDDCQGICPDCGGNLNEKRCECAAARNGKASPFDQLKQLL